MIRIGVLAESMERFNQYCEDNPGPEYKFLNFEGGKGGRFTLLVFVPGWLRNPTYLKVDFWSGLRDVTRIWDHRVSIMLEALSDR